jgi:hypothetical protein
MKQAKLNTNCFLSKIEKYLSWILFAVGLIAPHVIGIRKQVTIVTVYFAMLALYLVLFGCYYPSPNPRGNALFYVLEIIKLSSFALSLKCLNGIFASSLCTFNINFRIVFTYVRLYISSPACYYITQMKNFTLSRFEVRTTRKILATTPCDCVHSGWMWAGRVVILSLHSD